MSNGPAPGRPLREQQSPLSSEPVSVDLPEPKIDPGAFVAPGAHIYGDVTISDGVFVLFGVVIRAELDRIEVGAHTNIQDNSVLHCDEDVPCVLGKRVTVGHSAVVHGALVGDRCLIGIGAKLLNRSRLGEGAWLASGSVLAGGQGDTALDPGYGHPGETGAGADRGRGTRGRTREWTTTRS